MTHERDNTNRGVLFKNTRKRPDKKDPDYSGTLNIEGTEHWLSGWLNESGPNSKNPGEKYLSIVIGEEKQVQSGREQKRAPETFDDDIPF